MNTPSRFFISCTSIALLSLPAYADSLCVKRTASVRNNTVQLSSAFRTKDSQCQRGSVKIFSHQTGEKALQTLINVDGSESLLDADLLDGLSSESFASAASVATLSTQVSSVESSTTTIDGRVGDLEEETRVHNIVRLAMIGGDFSSLSNAISSLDSPSLANPYTINIGPGVFTVDAQLTIPTGVILRGSGIEQTVIRGTITSGSSIEAAAVLRLSAGASLNDLTVENVGSSSSYVTGVAIQSISESRPTVPASFPVAVDNIKISVRGSGGGTHTGLYVLNSDAFIRNITVDVTGATILSFGINAATTGGVSARYLYVNGFTANTASTSLGGIAFYSTGSSGSARVYSDLRDMFSISDSTGLFAGAFSTAYLSSSTIIATTTGLNGAGGIIYANYPIFDAADNATSSSGGAVTCNFASERSGGGYVAACE